MIRSHRASVIAVALLSIAGLAADGRPVLTIKGWGDVIDPDGDCTVRVEGEKVSVKVPGTAHDYSGELGRWNAPRILSTARGDFILDVKVSGTLQPADPGTIDGRRPYHGGGLLLIKDPRNYASLHRGSVPGDGRVRHYANFELRRDGELVISRYEIELDERDAYLRMERRGPLVYGMASQDGVNWKSYDPISVNFPDSLTAGLVVINSSEIPFACAFEGFAMYRKAAVEPAAP